MKKLSLKNINLKKFNFKLFKKLPAQEKRITVSTMVTLLRVILAPFIVVSMAYQLWGTAFLLFVIAALTDTIDGNIARWFNQKTFLGACLDPVADKVLLVSCFATLAFVQSPLPEFGIPTWFVLLVLVKDLIIIGGALIIFRIKGHLNVQPSWLGKVTTMAQIAFIIWLFACYFFKWMPVKTYYSMLGLVSVLAIASLVQYIQMGLAQLRK